MPDLISSVRRLKHDYSEEFSETIVKPAKELLKECLSNPGVFDDRQRRRIIRAYENAVKLENTFSLLGYSLEAQVNTFKDYVSLLTDDNVALFQSVLLDKISKDGVWLLQREHLLDSLQFAVNNTDAFCEKLNGMDHYVFENAASFSLSRDVEDAFRDDLDHCVTRGVVPYRITRDFDRKIDDTVHIGHTAFKDHVIGNIIKNLHEHAFVDITCFNYEVHLSTALDGDRLILRIENNGASFHGNVDDVFLEGVGDGSGIGLFSAKQCLENYGCTIRMEANQQAKYPVSFIISFPR